MAGSPEKDNATKFRDTLLREFGGWFTRIPDTYGGRGYRKPFDGVYIVTGIAMEWKYETGASFDLDGWRKDRPNQEIGLRKFWDSGAGPAVLFVFFKRKGRIERRWAYIAELVNREGRMPIKDFRDEIEFFTMLEIVKGGRWESRNFSVKRKKRRRRKTD